MVNFLARRLAGLVLTLLLVSVVTFTLIRFVPGDPVDIMYGVEGVDPATRGAIIAKLGLDQPLWVQYTRWLGRAVAGDFGFSYRAGVAVSQLMTERLLPTLLLVSTSLALSVILGIPLGVIAAVRRDSLTDLGVMGAALVSLSIPPFALGILLILVFALHFHLVPTMGYPRSDSGPLEVVRYLALPAVTLAAANLGVVVRLTRSAMLEVLGLDFIRTAHAKGLDERVVVYGHALRNALLPVITLIGLQLSYLIGGTVIVESVFAWPGVGGLIVDAILGRDYPVVQATVLLVAVMVVLVSLVVDMTYSVLDPRVRLA
ncbi:MAG: ABC transporter permease [Chloroflexota bacterium]